MAQPQSDTGIAVPVRRPHHHRRDSAASNSSFYSDVGMAQDEIFAGPTSESIPSSSASFMHRRRSRSNSNASWTFYRPEDEEGRPILAAGSDNAIEDDEEIDIEAAYDRRDSVSMRRQSSVYNFRASDPLIGQKPQYHGALEAHRTSQTIYIESEDLNIAVSGFNTSRIGYAIYITLSVLTLGLAWLLFHWMPMARVKLVGAATPLGDCDWVVVENQWKEINILQVKKREFGETLAMIFGPTQFKNKLNSADEYYDTDPLVPTLHYIDYRYIRFFYHTLHDKFMINNGWKDPHWESVSKLRKGLESEEKILRQIVFGDNAIEIEEKTSVQLLVDEIINPLFTFQIASIILWSVDEYFYYANMKRLAEVAHFECGVRILRSGFWAEADSSDLVPGDVYEVSDHNLTILPCDSLLLTGECIVNESMLTGESVPVSKYACTEESFAQMDLAAKSLSSQVTRNFLYAGTKIIRARKPVDDAGDEAIALAMVVRTGFNTSKGSLVRSMLFPKPSGFKFYKDSFKFLGVMGIIAAIGFCASLINFIRLGLEPKLVVIRALDLITIVVPPALPATLTIGVSSAMARLKQLSIFCISPQRINVAGKLDVMCFDKTGTLTEDGLDVLGVHCVTSFPHKFTDLYDSAQGLLKAGNKRDPRCPFTAVHNTMTTCHSLRNVDDEMIGDPLDLKMFDFTGWIFKEGMSAAPSAKDKKDKKAGANEQAGGRNTGLSPSTVRPPGTEASSTPVSLAGQAYGTFINPSQNPEELGILKTFEFVSELRRSSVIVRHFGDTGADIYVKGAPECMRQICNSMSFPVNYDEMLEHYTKSGYRVIACATKHVEPLSWIKAQKMSRGDAESGLTFSGFIVFENKLKETTTPVIEELRKAHIRTVMCTGDNILTAISVARQCKLIDDSFVFVPHINGPHDSPDAIIEWKTVDETPLELDEHSLIPKPTSYGGDVSGPYSRNNLQNYSLAVSGEVFRWVVDYAPEKYLNKVLQRGQVYARMSPDEKQELMEKLQKMDYTVGFCGDGANDCGALKAADVGISLSDAEASVAAPFTSRIFDITCVPKVIKEGRAALVTSFACFKFMALYSAIQFISVSILYKSGSNLGDLQFLFIDLLLILPIAVLMSWSGPYPLLSIKRPTASLVSAKVLVPLISQIFLFALIQLSLYWIAERQPWYIPPQLTHNKSNIPSSANSTLFLISDFQYIYAALFLSVGKPFRMPMRYNYALCATVAAAVMVTIYMVVIPADWVVDWMQLTPMPASWKAVLLLAAAGGYAAAMAGEEWAFPRMARGVKRLIRGGAEKSRKGWKVTEEGMRF
ncbi:Similar to Probable cation-transporting ATPase C1672.11c; acc. no. O74431 [Pyronema omphalodes CBS 100304]|uniref:Cation-transporting ATPase n=1 Tax=Pyronema omphalodes (strain CBS 100304) TaxID=1076935 RepID=U4LSL9_PYROM|nr:Similar to Probable cation-transporting ATPase C1672.11c; acc. no. O74431 [Pyronema omphalodes CBS 100304]